MQISEYLIVPQKKHPEAFYVTFIIGSRPTSQECALLQEIALYGGLNLDDLIFALDTIPDLRLKQICNDFNFRIFTENWEDTEIARYTDIIILLSSNPTEKMTKTILLTLKLGKKVYVPFRSEKNDETLHTLGVSYFYKSSKTGKPKMHDIRLEYIISLAKKIFHL